MSDQTWDVYNGDPASGAVNRLDFAQLVCRNANSPSPCPGLATIYGAQTNGWTANLSPIPAARWIWMSGIIGSTPQADLKQFYFSRTFTVGLAPTSATVQIAVDDLAEVRVNGQSVGTYGSIADHSVAVAAQNALQTFNIAPYLVVG